VIVGGAPLSKEVEQFLMSIGFPITVGYGATECSPLISYVDWHDFIPGSCGRAIENMEACIASSDPRNIPGEILARGSGVMLGYYKNEEATREVLDEDGWYHTGDLGTMDEQGNIFIRGRIKNMLLGANGQNIYPEEAEDQVVSYSIFDECVVVQRGDKLVALVYASDQTLKAAETTRESLNLEAIRQEINQHLPKYCQLAKLEQRSEEFEKTPKKSIRRFLYH
jgi:long-chain acyl-CoA synthetase